MFKVELARSFEKDFKKISKEVQSEVFNKWIPLLKENPEIGKRFVGKNLQKFIKLAFRFKRNDYRIVYQVYKTKVVIVLLAIGNRENFYKKLRRRT